MFRKIWRYLSLSFIDRRLKWVLIAITGILLWWFSLPSPIFKDPGCTVLIDRNSELLGARISDDGQWRFPHNEKVPLKFQKCITQFEDRYFKLHNGINPVSVARALLLNIRSGKVVSGGSTLTMQTIRLSRKGKGRTIKEKLIEAWLSLRLEFSYSKDEILALYASNAPFGSNVVGLDAASWRYFGKSPESLSWAEAATLAVLPNSPSLIFPGKNHDLLKIKRDALLLKLKNSGVISTETYELSLLEPLPKKPFPLPQTAMHLLDRAMTDGHKGQVIHSTLDANLQENINIIVSRYQEQYSANNIHNIGVLVLDVESGCARAYVGNTSITGHSEYGCEVDMIGAPRSTGSILKPFLYAFMLNEGEILPNTLVPDIPVQLGSFNPENYSHTYDGAVPASRALSRSLNIPCVKMLQQYGYEKFHYRLQKIGFTTLTKSASHYGLSIIIGGAEAKLWDICGAYAKMARTLKHYSLLGNKYDPQDFRSPSYLFSTESELSAPDGSEAHAMLDAGSIWFTFQAMADVSRPEEDAYWQEFTSSTRLAWKTGTSFGSRDAWAVGITQNYIVGVWVGNADGEGRPGLTGLNYAAPVLFEVAKLMPQSSWFRKPLDDLQEVAVCRYSGYRASDICEYVDTVLVPYRGTESGVCPYHRIIHLDASGQWQVNSNCESTSQMQHVSWFVLPPVMEFFYKSRNPFYKILPPFREDCQEKDAQIPVMDMIYPKEESKLYIPLEMNGQRGKVIFRAAHRDPDAIIYWYVDEVFQGTTTHYHQMGLAPEAGRHILTLVDQNGESLKQPFEILERPKKKE